MLTGPRHRGLTTMRALFTCSQKWEKRTKAGALWYSELSINQQGSRSTVFIAGWTTHPCIVCQVCANRGAAPAAARDSSVVARALSRRCNPHTGNGGHSWSFSSFSLSLAVGFSIGDRAMDFVRSAQQGNHYHAGVIEFLP